MMIVYWRAQFADQVLDAGGGTGIERRTGLVHEDDFGVYGDGPGNAQPLMLPAGETQRRIVQPVLDLIPERHAPRLVSTASSIALRSRTPAIRKP